MMELNGSSATDDMSDDSNDILTQLKHDGTRSSAHSTAPLSDSITASDFEYGNDSRTDQMNLNESLNNFDAMLQARGSGSGGRTQRLNSSFGSLNKTTSVRNFDGPKPIYARRRSSVHGCTPSESYEMSPTFHTEFKASVDDWNSELPVDDEDGDDITSSYSQLNASIKSVRSPTTTDKVKVSTVERDGKAHADQSLLSSMKSPSSKQHVRKLKKTKSQGSTDPSVSQNISLPHPPSRSLLPSGKSSFLKSKSTVNSQESETEVIPRNRVNTNSSKHKERKTGSLSKLESRFAQSVRCIRGGMSFRSTDSSKSNNSLSKSEHYQKNRKSVLVDGGVSAAF
jgi:hypothetical protein